MDNFQFIIRSPIYIFLKKHYCPHCSHLLKVIMSSRMVYPGSEDAKQLNVDYSMVGGVYQSGAVKIISNEFECLQCKRQFSIDEMKRIEGVSR